MFALLITCGTGEIYFSSIAAMSSVKFNITKIWNNSGVPFISHPNIALDLFLSMGLTYKFKKKINLQKNLLCMISGP